MRAIQNVEAGDEAIVLYDELRVPYFQYQRVDARNFLRLATRKVKQIAATK